MARKNARPAWLNAVLNRRMLICVFTGFASGLPLYLLLNLVPAWLKAQDVSLKVIGVFALAQIPFTWKFVWAPLLDRYDIVAWLGRRRGWMFVTQIGLLAAIAWMGQVPVMNQPLPLPGFLLESLGLSGFTFPWLAFTLAAVVALLSATQDIAIDAFRREILPDEELGLGNAIHINAYRIGGLVPGALSLILADRMPWGWVFAITAAFMLPGLAMTLMVREPAVAKGAPRTLRAAVVEPFNEFFSRHGLQPALLALAFIFLYKLGDSLCTALATPFYMDIGFSTFELGIVAKNAGLWCSVLGGLLGGLWMIRLGINRALWLFGVVQVVSILGFVWLAWLGPPFFAPPDYSRMTPNAFAQAVTDNLLRNACASREAVAGQPRNARTLVDNMLRPYFNFERMGRFAIGAAWENAKDDQKKQLSDALHHVLLREHFGAVYQYCDAKLAFKPLETGAEAREVTVDAEMRHADAPPIAIAYSLIQTDRGWKIFDVAVEGKSLTHGLISDFAGEADDLKNLTGWLRGRIVWDFWACIALAVVIGIEALGVGLGSAALFAFMARATHPAYTATQLALFTSLMATPRTLINATAGWLVEGSGGWFHFFWLCFFLAIPGMLLLLKVAPWNGDWPQEREDGSR
ncbi:MAG: MFS transporter [Zoogloeaceae bacterium]|jgi:PAT family beta-lactamase induction signal transducer AmpG|nr:MFS transporter [Zoogloeaceae bacterium]